MRRRVTYSLTIPMVNTPARLELHQRAMNALGMRLAFHDVLMTDDRREYQAQAGELAADPVAVGAGDDPELQAGGGAIMAFDIHGNKIRLGHLSLMSV